METFKDYVVFRIGWLIKIVLAFYTKNKAAYSGTELAWLIVYERRHTDTDHQQSEVYVPKHEQQPAQIATTAMGTEIW